ncbi:MAG: ABC transporter ATP-binding protein [Clostridia bacterium]|nr:ABC transporter ATP-binding protein [Clostridia bacterium]
MDTVIEIKNLVKTFKEVKAVRNLSFGVRRGEFFAFLGVNGAGKSTTISILCGQLEKDGGEVWVDGINIDEDADAPRRALGVVFQNSVLDKPLTVRQNLESRAALYGIVGDAFQKRLSELSALLDFSDLLDRSVGKLSGGQRRRIDIARALLHSPRILILDEPTTGLDPQTRQLLWQVISALRREEGMTVFLTTHYMEEAAEADYVVILDAGSIVAEGKPHELKSKYAGDFVTLYGVSDEEVDSLSVPYERAGDDSVRISVESTAEATELILRAPGVFRDYEIVKGKMDDVFLAVTGKRLVGGEG